MSLINKNLLDVYIVLTYIINYMHLSSVITIIANNSVNSSGGKTLGIHKIDECLYSVRKIGINNDISLTSAKTMYSALDYYYFNVEPGTYEIKITTDKKLVSLDNLILGKRDDLNIFCPFDSIVVINSGDKINITDLSYAFDFCQHLESIDLSMLDMSGVSNFRGIFSQCKTLVSVNLGSLLPQKINNMNSMFYECSSLISINLSSFDTSKVFDMSYMFFWLF